MLREDEPTSAEYVLENLPELARRWANKNPGKQGETARTYQGRARWGLELWLQWNADPVRFRFPDAVERPKTVGPKPESSKRAKAREEEAPANDSGPATKKPFRSFPLGDGREVVFSVPEGLTMREVKKFIFHILTLASDFDPSEPSQSQLFALARRD